MCACVTVCRNDNLNVREQQKVSCFEPKLKCLRSATLLNYPNTSGLRLKTTKGKRGSLI